MAYTEIAPSPLLRPWVECFWTQREESPAAHEQRVLPDGCADLVFDLTDCEGTVVGTMTKPLVLPPGVSHDFLGVRFRPGRAAAFLRIPLAEITDARVPLADVWRDGPRVILSRVDGEGSSALRAGRSFASLRMTLERELIRRLRPDRDPRVDAAIERIVRGADRVEVVAREIGISRQHLARQFLHHVGVSPKTFARVMRFRRVLASGAGEDWRTSRRSTATTISRISSPISASSRGPRRARSIFPIRERGARTRLRT